MLLITGITGHSGRYFLQELIDNKCEESIRCVIRETSDTAMLDNSGLNIEKIVGDLNDPQLVDLAMANVDTVIHIGSIFYSINVMTAAVKHDVKRAILVHTTGIYSKYKSASEEYKEIELEINRIIERNKSSIGLVYLRPTMIYGYLNDNNMIVFIKLIDKVRLIPVIDRGQNLLQPVNGKDLGKAYYQILNTPEIMEGDYILSGEKPISMIDMFKLISSYLDKKTYFLNIPLKLGVFIGRCLSFLTFGKVDYIEKIQRMGEDRSFSHEKAQKDFNYQSMPFTKGLKIEVEEYIKSRNGRQEFSKQ